MSDPFQYITRTGTQGQVTTGPSYRGVKTADEVYAEALNRIGTQPLTIPLAIRTVLQVALEWSAQGWKIDPLEDLIGIRLTCGGSFDSTDFQPTWDSMSMALAGYFGDTGRQLAQDAITFENAGHQGRIVPVFARVSDNWTGTADHYTPGKSILIELANRNAKIAFDRAAGSKVQFRKADNTIVEASDYGDNRGVRITALVPADVTGPITVILSISINGSIRTAEYASPLT